MAVTLKVKAKVEKKSPTAIIVDRIVELKKQIDALAPVAKEYDALVKNLRGQAMEQDPKQVVSFEGTDHTVVFSEAGKTRTIIDMKEVKKALGNEVFFEVAKVTLGDIDKYLSDDDKASLIKEEQDGPRKISFVEK
jgi:hypothetical protein